MRLSLVLRASDGDVEIRRPWFRPHRARIASACMTPFRPPVHAEDILLGLMVLLIIVVLWLRRVPRFPYTRSRMLLTPTEHAFLRVLERAVAGRWRVLAKVRIADLVTPRPGLHRTHAQVALNRIAQKHVDFVLVDGAFRVVAAIELDDASHAQRDRRRRDRFVDEVFRVAGVPLLHASAGGRYTEAAIRDLLSSLRPALAPHTPLPGGPANPSIRSPARPSEARREPGRPATSTPASAAPAHSHSRSPRGGR